MPKTPAESRQPVSKAPRRHRAPGTDGDSAGDAPQPVGILPFLTVAIGASAGGLHAFTEFLEHLPPDTGMAFVLIQHLDPDHKSLLVDLLGAAYRNAGDGSRRRHAAGAEHGVRHSAGRDDDDQRRAAGRCQPGAGARAPLADRQLLHLPRRGPEPATPSASCCRARAATARAAWHEVKRHGGLVPRAGAGRRAADARHAAECRGHRPGRRPAGGRARCRPGCSSTSRRCTRRRRRPTHPTRRRRVPRSSPRSSPCCAAAPAMISASTSDRR